MEAPLDSSVKEIGFTLSPRPQRCNATEALFINWSLKLHSILKSFSKSYSYYHEFDNSGRLHFHGVLQPYDMIKFKKCSGQLRRLGFVKYETRFKNKEKWLAYCSKDVVETKEVYGLSHPWLPVTPDVIKQIKSYLKDIELRRQNAEIGWFARCCIEDEEPN